MKSSPSLLREPFGRPSGLPDFPGCHIRSANFSGSGGFSGFSGLDGPSISSYLPGMDKRTLKAAVALKMGHMTGECLAGLTESRQSRHMIDAAAWKIREQALIDAWNAINAIFKEDTDP